MDKCDYLMLTSGVNFAGLQQLVKLLFKMIGRGGGHSAVTLQYGNW